jgi:tellurite resistance-related uncharacterized protein
MPAPPPPWPADLVPTRRTAVFTETTLPTGLRRAHSTRAGTWARIHLLEGRLRFREAIAEADRELGPGIHAVIHPGREHEVAPLGPVRFFIEFLVRP